MSYLYRHYSENKTLLYVGVSLSAIERLRQHREHSAWFEKIAEVKIEKCASREDALTKETAAIKNEKPIYNIKKTKEKEPTKFQKLEESKQRLLNQTVNFCPLYKRGEAADVLRVSEGTINKLINSGQLGVVEVNGKWMISGWQIIDFIESKTSPHTKQAQEESP